LKRYRMDLEGYDEVIQNEMAGDELKTDVDESEGVLDRVKSTISDLEGRLLGVGRAGAGVAIVRAGQTNSGHQLGIGSGGVLQTLMPRYGTVSTIRVGTDGIDDTGRYRRYGTVSTIRDGIDDTGWYRRYGTVSTIRAVSTIRDGIDDTGRYRRYGTVSTIRDGIDDTGLLRSEYFTPHVKEAPAPLSIPSQDRTVCIDDWFEYLHIISHHMLNCPPFTHDAILSGGTRTSHQ